MKVWTDRLGAGRIATYRPVARCIALDDKNGIEEKPAGSTFALMLREYSGPSNRAVAKKIRAAAGLLLKEAKEPGRLFLSVKVIGEYHEDLAPGSTGRRKGVVIVAAGMMFGPFSESFITAMRGPVVHPAIPEAVPYSLMPKGLRDLQIAWEVMGS